MDVMAANKKYTGDCDTCKIVSTANCSKCEMIGKGYSEPSVGDRYYVEVDWESLPDKTGKLE